MSVLRSREWISRGLADRLFFAGLLRLLEECVNVDLVQFNFSILNDREHIVENRGIYVSLFSAIHIHISSK